MASNLYRFLYGLILGQSFGYAMKKRYILLGLLALEIAMLPLAGHILYKTAGNFDMSAFSKPQRAINVKLGEEPGVTRYMVVTNAPFTVTSESMIGQFDVNIYPSGLINGKPFGLNAQAPGALKACGLTKTTAPRIIYKADKGTETGEGEILSKAVLVEIRYEAYYKPDLKILPQRKSDAILTAQPCEKTAAKPT